VEDERLRFMARLMEGAGHVHPLCAEFGISRKTGYKIYERCCRTTIWVPSTMRRAASSRSRIRLARKCYPCLRN